MILKIKSIATKYSAFLICAVATLAAPLISQSCEVIWYQEKEPEDFDLFVHDISFSRKNKRIN
ncbi:MAG: hypothetical protein IKP92_09405 [Lachnospiraceae bacterium]|nr:hypothetical protein [Lachnospiraceae bacterium]